jgi:phosphatidylglycerophosphate synthase
MGYEGKTFGDIRKITYSEDRFLPMRLGRKVSVYLSVLFLKLGLTPNSISFARFIIGTIGISLLAIGTYPLMVAGLLIFQFAILLDLCDGEMFRYLTNKTGKKSTILKGNFLDKVFDNAYRPMLLLAAGIGCAHFFNDATYLLLGGISAALIVFDVTIKLRTTDLLIYKKQTRFLEEEKQSSDLKKSALLDTFYELWRINNPLTLFFWFGVLGYMHLFLWIYTPLLLLQVLKTFYNQWSRISGYDKIILEEMYGKN